MMQDNALERCSAKLALAIEAMESATLSENAMVGVRMLLQDVSADIEKVAGGGKN